MNIAVENLSFSYADKNVLSNVSFIIPAGSIVTIAGTNGCGKSTLLKCMSGALKFDSGIISYGGRDMKSYKTKEFAAKTAFLSQSHHIPYDLTVRDLVSFGRYPHLRIGGFLSADDRRIIEQALEAVGIEEFQHKNVCTLSGGERQKVWIAMTLAQEAEVLLLDEPTTFLDIAHQLDVLELLKNLNKTKGITVVMVLHDINHAVRYSDYVTVISKGNVYRNGSPGDIIDECFFSDVYGVNVKKVYDDVNSCNHFIALSNGFI